MCDGGRGGGDGFLGGGVLGVGAGTRRLRGNINILCIPGDTALPCPMGFNDNEFYGDDGTCEGDSGSSAYDNFLFLQDKAVSFGVLSRGGDNAGDAGQPATLCKGSLYTRLDKYRDLVLQAATEASKNWTLYPKPVPDWTVYVPPKPPKVTPEAGPPKKTPQDDGVGCATNDECKSKLCVDTGAGLACTQPCDASVVPTTCASGFVCKASACVQDLGAATPPPAAAPSTTTTSGCSVGASSGRGSEAPLGLLVAAAAAIFGLGIRRRSARAGG